MNLFFMLSAIIVIFPTSAFAVCSAAGDSKNIFVNHIAVQRDVPVGTLLGTFVSGASTTFSCDRNNNNGMTVGVKAYGDYVTTINSMRVYKTNIEGIGYAVGGQSMCGSVQYVGHKTYDNNPNQVAACANSGTWNTINGSFEVKLYKIGPTGSGTVNSRQVGAGILKYNQYSTWASEVPVRFNDFNVTTLSCSVETKNIYANFERVRKDSFSGVGSSSGSKEFNIGLNCLSQARIHITMDWEQNSETLDNSIIALTNHGSPNVATGVGVQILYNNVPVKKNEEMQLKVTEGGLETFPMLAKYVQTLPEITPGKADAVATFTLTYR